MRRTQTKTNAGSTVNAELREFIDRVIVPALVDRFLAETHGGTQPTSGPPQTVDLPKPHQAA